MKIETIVERLKQIKSRDYMGRSQYDCEIQKLIEDIGTVNNEIYRDEIMSVVVTIMDRLNNLDRLQEDKVFNMLDEEIDNLCGNPDYRKYN